MAVNMKQIAERCGFSRQTVGYILTGQKAHLFKPDTRRRVLEAAKELGYRPHAGAQSMVSKRFNAVGILCGKREEFSYLHHGLLEQICNSLEERGMHLAIAFLPDEQIINENNRPKFLSHDMLDGLILNYTHGMPEGMDSLLRSSSMPCVWLNVKQDLNAVYPDDFAAAAAVTRRALEAGCIPYYYGKPASEQEAERLHYSVRDRYEGFLQAVGGSAERSFSAEDGQTLAAVISQLVKSGSRAAVVSYSMSHALRMMVLLQNLGVRVPEQVLLTGFNPNAFHDPVVDAAIQAVCIPQARMGAAAVAMLTRMIEEKNFQAPSRPIEYELDRVI